MKFPHWIDFRTYKMDNGNLCTVGRQYFIYIFILLVLQAFLSFVAIFYYSENAEPMVYLLLFLSCVFCLGVIYYFVFFQSIERKITFYRNGEIEISDRSIMKHLPIKSFNWKDVKSIEMKMSSSIKSIKTCYAIFRMNDGKNISIDSSNMPIYPTQGRKLHQSLKAFLSEIGYHEKLSEPENWQKYW